MRASVEPPQSFDLASAAAALRHPLISPATIGEDGSVTPQGAAVVAVLQNPTLRAARSRRGVAAAQVLQAGILPNPQVSASMDFPVAGATDGTVNAFGLGASWDVTSLVTKEQERLAALHEAESVDLDIAWQEWQVAMGAKLRATRVLWLSVQHDQAAQQVARAEQVARETNDNTSAGLMTVLEREAAAASLQRRRTSLLAIEASLASESAYLRAAMGLPADSRVRIVSLAGAVPLSLPTDEELFNSLEYSRLDLAALRAGYASQESKLHAAVLSQFPKIGIGITRARDTSDVGTIGFGVTLDLPIFDRGQGRIAVERATRRQLFDELAARTFEAHADAARALVELRAVGPQAVEAGRTAERLTSLAHRLVDARTLGEADILQVSQAQNDAADAVIEEIRMRQQEAELRIALEVATGRLFGDTTP